MAKVAVIGGGPAGIMAACAAAGNGHGVTLFERNEKTGKKLYITGKGRCNLTNSAEMPEFMENIARNPRFLYSALGAFDNAALMALIEGLGTPLKVERGGRVFPVSDKSSDVLRALNTYIKKCGVSVRLNTRVGGIIIKDGAARGITLPEGDFPCDAVVVACGGLSYPQTGSDGDGYAFARQAGLNVTECGGSLVPLETAQEWPREVMGLSLKNVRLSLYNGKKMAYSEQGEMLFTHFGVSGPLVLSASAHADMKKEVTLHIDLKPALDAQTLDARLVRDFEKYSRKRFINSLSDLLPSGLIPVIARLSGIPADKPVCSITKAERQALGTLLKDLTLDVTKKRPVEEAIITRGGVDVKCVNPSTMEAKSVKELYFAGEVLDVDAYTGGFNLQIAFSTGYLAGSSIV